MRKPRFLVLSIGAMALAMSMSLAGCGKAMDESSTGSTAAYKATTTPATAQSGEDFSNGGMSIPGQAPLHNAARQPGAERSVVKSGSLEVEVDNLEKAEKAMKAAVKDQGGYIKNEEGNNLAGDQPSLHVLIRIPQKSFDDSIATFVGLGRRKQQTISASDTTEEILDREARIKQLQAEQEVLTQHGKAPTMNPGFESIKDRLKALQDEKSALEGQAAMSTIDLTLQQKLDANMVAASHATWGSDSWNAAMSSASNAFRFFGAVGIWLLAYSPIWGIVLGIAIWARKTHRRNGVRPVSTAMSDMFKTQP